MFKYAFFRNADLDFSNLFKTTTPFKIKKYFAELLIGKEIVHYKLKSLLLKIVAKLC